MNILRIFFTYASVRSRNYRHYPLIKKPPTGRALGLTRGRIGSIFHMNYLSPFQIMLVKPFPTTPLHPQYSLGLDPYEEHLMTIKQCSQTRGLHQYGIQRISLRKCCYYLDTYPTFWAKADVAR